jgi:hypothetical protein
MTSDDYEPNPPWVNKLLRKHTKKLASLVPPEWVPEPDVKWTYEEYGCGHYGCVLPVPDGRVVLKITSDPTEAAFVTIYLGLKDKPIGITRYHQIVELPDQYRRRRTFAIWRDEAENVGGLSSPTRMPVYRERYGDDIRSFDWNLA